MLWAIFPIFAQLFYTSGSYVQNFLADTAFPKGRAGALIIARLPCFIMGMLLMYAVFGRIVLVLPLATALGFVAAGVINVFGSVFSFKALQEGDAADVIIFSQLSPLISLGLGVMVLGEKITTAQGLGFLFIMAAIAVVVTGSTTKKERTNPNFKVIRLTLISAFFSILSDIVFVYFARGILADTTLYAQSFFFFSLGSAVTVLVLFICLGKWRKATRTVFVKSKNRNRNWLGLIADNLSFLLGELLFKYGLLIVPVVAMMTVVSKVTNLFASFFFTVFLGKIFPKFIHGKRLTKAILVRYLISSIFIVAGIMIMN
jgi:uncharacterized membrane protein